MSDDTTAEAPRATVADAFKSRIVGYGEVAPDQLLANPFNWRVHPHYQQEAIRSVLDEVGFVQAVIVNRRTGHLVDGHMRVAVSLREGVAQIPVVYVDLSEAEEHVILATLDPIGALAQADSAKYGEFLAGIVAKTDGTRNLLDALTVAGPQTHSMLEAILKQDGGSQKEAPASFPEVDEGLETNFKCPRCSYTWSRKPK